MIVLTDNDAYTATPNNCTQYFDAIIIMFTIKRENNIAQKANGNTRIFTRAQTEKTRRKVTISKTSNEMPLNAYSKILLFLNN